jgi:DNA-binding beta-propeller fold protein YncE
MRNIVVALAGLGLIAGCSAKKAAYNGNAGSVAISRDGQRVYAVDSDNDTLQVARPDGSKLTEVKVGHNPARVVVGPDERIYISNRGERTVSVLSGDKFTELARIAVGVEPSGLSLDAEGKKLYVVSATALDDASQGTLTAIDTASLQSEWTLPVGEEPRGVAVIGNKAYVSVLKKGAVTVVDLKQHQIASGVDLSSPDSKLDLASNPNAMRPGGAVDVTASPDGTRVYAPHVWQLMGNIESSRGIVSGTGGGGSYGSSGPCNSQGSIVAAGLATIETTTDTAKTDDLSVCNDPITDGTTAQPKDFPPSLMPSAGLDGHVVQGPSAAVVDPTGNWLFVANRNSNNLVVVPTHRRAAGRDSQPRQVIDVGAAPDGIAIAADGKTAYVYSQFDHSLSVIKQNESGDALQEMARVKLTNDTLPADQVEGRKLFFSAVNPKMTGQNVGIACSSCHMEGREDGHVWQFPDGPRQTPSLAGRHLELTAPYHWAGLFPTLGHFFKETIVGRMGGAGLEPTEADRLTAFIVNMPAAENPFRGRPDLLDAQVRGKAAFARAGCESCHTGEVFTDNSMHNVGTLSSKDRLELLVDGLEDHSVANFPQLQAVNTPSLLGLARTAPYLHDGSVRTLRGRLDQASRPKLDGTDHGDTSMLSSTELDDLEQYLASL